LPEFRQNPKNFKKMPGDVVASLAPV